jgi:hypothetical protein
MCNLALDPISESFADELAGAKFAGVLDVTAPSKTAGELEKQDVLDNLDGEKETMPGLESSDQAELFSTLNEVSKGVSDRTHNEYRRSVSLAGPVYHCMTCSFDL